MKKIAWDESLSVEVDEIDEDHRKLVKLFNILSDSVTDGDSTDYIGATLDELISLTAWHFKHEERLMILYNYDGLAEHKSEHDELIESVKVLQQFYKENKLLTNEDIEYLESWLTEHILGHDMKLGFYLMKVM